MYRTSSGSPLFHEEQRFRQPLLWILVIFLVAAAWAMFIVQIVYKKPFGTNPAPDAAAWIIWVLFGIGFPFFFYALRMTTELREDALTIRFAPFSRRRIALQDILSFEVREYHPLREYGGWGIRRSLKHGAAYSVSGNRGVQLVLQNQKRVLVGSQEPERLVNMLRDLLRRQRR